MHITREEFGKAPDGAQVYLFTLKNRNGMEVKITNYGGIVTSLLVPDREGKFGDVVLGFDKLDGYLKGHPYFGAIVGRYGNRIAKGVFSLDGKTCHLSVNNGPNHLHGGTSGFDKKVWDVEEQEDSLGAGLKLTYISKNGEEGYPGNLKATVTYTLLNDNSLKITYEAETDKPTVVNLTHHSYFNLAGAGNGDILSQEMMIDALKYTPVDDQLIPTGEMKDLKGTEMDFFNPAPIGSRIAQVKGGYDHNYILNKKPGEMKVAARVYEPVSGRLMEVWTTEPGVQFYTGNFLDGTITGKGGKVYRQHYGFCLETQHFPDSPNHPEFPSTVLRPGQKYGYTTIYKFLTM